MPLDFLKLKAEMRRWDQILCAEMRNLSRLFENRVSFNFAGKLEFFSYNSDQMGLKVLYVGVLCIFNWGSFG